MQTSYGFAQRLEFAAFVEQRLEQHRLWQHEAEHCLVEEIIDEVQDLPRRKPRTERLFELLPEHIQISIAANLERHP